MRIRRQQLVVTVLIIVIIVEFMLFNVREMTVNKYLLKNDHGDHVTNNCIAQTHNMSNIDYTKIWSNLLTFVPPTFSKCQDLFPDINKTDIYGVVPDVKGLHHYFTEEVSRNTPGRVEGHTGQSVEETLIYIQLSKVPFVKTICETGFNAGHSTFVWLTGKPDTHVYSFDLGEHPYSRPMSKFLQKLFPGRLNVTWGSSLTTLPTFQNMFPNIKCDLIIIDGGHTYEIATADFFNFKQMANQPNIVVLDDYPTRRHRILGSMWEEAKSKKHVAEKFRCTYFPKKDIGLTFGYYVNN